MKPLKANTHTVIQAIRECICDVAKTGRRFKSDTQWTQCLKKRLGMKAKALGFETWCTGSNCEWLYDVVWIMEKKENLLRVPLILESEWKRHRGSLIYDFQKLVVGRAEVKAFVFSHNWNGEVLGETQKLMATVNKFIRKSFVRDEHYLFFAWDDSEKRFDEYQCQVKNSVVGKLREFPLPIS